NCVGTTGMQTVSFSRVGRCYQLPNLQVAAVHRTAIRQRGSLDQPQSIPHAKWRDELVSSHYLSLTNINGTRQARPSIYSTVATAFSSGASKVPRQARAPQQH